MCLVLDKSLQMSTIANKHRVMHFAMEKNL